MNEVYISNIEEILTQLNSNKEEGLSEQEVQKKQEQYGKNQFAEQKSESLGQKILSQLSDISTIILFIAAGLSFALAARTGEGFIEPIVILCIIVMNLILAITQERSAEKALDALSNMNSPTSIVLRGGVKQEIDSVHIVPGDIILIATGSLIPADARLISSSELGVDESALTGESEASEKDAATMLIGKVPTADQKNMVFSGCLVTAGHGEAVVTTTGMNTQMGKIAGYLNKDQKIKTPLQNRLDKVSKLLSFIAVISAVILFGIGTRQGEDTWSMVYLAVTLAVAAVPETLALIVTLILSQGVENMAKKNALIRNLPAVETLGSTSVICTDKTGTLTQNRMSITDLWIPGGKPFKASEEFTEEQTDFIIKMALASNASVEKAEDGIVNVIGSPTEIAILHLLQKKGLDKAQLEEKYTKVGEVPFSSSRKMMTTVHKVPNGGYMVISKGAIDILPFKEGERTFLVKNIHDLFAEDALRVIALGSKYIDILPSSQELDVLESDLEFKGIIGLIDPPRPECAEAIKKAKKAGIRTVMITGDHAVTAGAIAKSLGILSNKNQMVTGMELQEMSDEDLCQNIEHYSVYARVSPEDKIRIVEAWQENGDVVAMTGDGVNDAPALTAADVGVAMGKTGTEVAKSAADMVLTDDNFATIVDAVHEGRNVFSNIRKTIYFLLVCNISEICIILGAQLMGWGSPLTSVMLLLINVLGDGIPGLQLAYEKSDPRIMNRKPIGRNESFLNTSLTYAIVRQTITFSVVAWIGYYLGKNAVLSSFIIPSNEVGQTMAFLIVGWTSIFHIFTVRSRKSILKSVAGIKENPRIVIGSAAMIVLFAVIVLVPPFAHVFGMTTLGLKHWLIVIGLTIIPTIIAETFKLMDVLNGKRKYRYRIVRYRVDEGLGD